MSVGDGSLISPESYVAIGRETVFGTYTTISSSIDFLSCSIKTAQEGKILEEINRTRFNTKRTLMGKTIEGDIESYFKPASTASVFLLANAFGGSITSAVLSAGVSYTHEFAVGTMTDTYTSLCINERKGGGTTGKVWHYAGAKVNEMVIGCEIDDALKMTNSLIIKDSTQTTNDIESALTICCANPLNFISGRLSIESSFASLTASSFWNIQSFEYTHTNNLKSDADSRRIGSDTLQVLPVGMANAELSLTMRFDTTTAYDAMLAASTLSCEFIFEGSTITGGSARESLKIQLPRVFINESGDPEIGGPDEILKSEVTLHILNDCSSAGGFATKAIVTNGVADYT